MIAEEPAPAPDAGPLPRRRNLRLRVLLALSATSFGLFAFSRLDRSAAERLGPAGEILHDLLSPGEKSKVPLSPAGRQFEKDVKALGGQPTVWVNKPGFLGYFGREEWFNATFTNRSFDDLALARLAESHGDRIGGLYLNNTAVTDAGLRGLEKFTALRHLAIRADARSQPGGAGPATPGITDAGMGHLRGLDHLWSLSLTGQPITDAGLAEIGDLPELNSLYLSDTRARGVGMDRWKSLPGLFILYLDGTPLAEDSLKDLSGATALHFLALNRVHLTGAAIPLLKKIPALDHLEIIGCGFLDEEVATLIKPGLKIKQR